MSTVTFVPGNILTAAFPQTRRVGTSIRTDEVRARYAATKAAATAAEPFTPRASVTTDGKIVSWRGRPAARGVPRNYAFTAPRRRITAPVVLIAMRADTNALVAIEAFEVEDGARLNAWIARAAVAAGIRLVAHTAAGTRAARAAVVADLSVTTPRAHRALVVAGRFDRAAVMTAAVAVARANRARTGSTWAAAMAVGLRTVWAGAKADRLGAAH